MSEASRRHREAVVNNAMNATESRILVMVIDVTSWHQQVGDKEAERSTWSCCTKAWPLTSSTLRIATRSGTSSKGTCST